MDLQSKPIVQKYGGTSMGSIERIGAVADRIRDKLRGPPLAIVVSAMAGETNRFVELVHCANPKAAPEHYDMAASAGEQVSAALMAASLEARGVPARAFLAHQVGILTDNIHSKARIRAIKTDTIRETWAQGLVPVIAGFQGVTSSNALTTLGRGGSDTSAVALAAALEAQLCEINTDVDGIFTADPRIVPDARRVEIMDFDTALELAALGSKVLHSRCVEIAAKYNLPLVVRNTFRPELKIGTRIMNFSAEKALEAPIVSGVTLARNVAKITLEGLEIGTQSISDVFEDIARNEINVDIIIHNLISSKKTMRLGFTVEEKDLGRTVELMNRYKEQHPGLAITSRPNLAKVSVVGLGMKSFPGVASKVFSTLARADIQVLMISTSEIKISCVVDAEHGQDCVRLLHEAFI